MGELSKLKGLGPESEKYLNEVGINTKKELEEMLRVEGVEIEI